MQNQLTTTIYSFLVSCMAFFFVKINDNYAGTPTIIHVSGDSARFDIPEDLRNRRSIQLVWSKDDGTQCVCPPVEQFMSLCACNIENPNSNMVVVTSYSITIFNLTQMMGEGEVTLYFVHSVSSGCLNTCNLRSISGIYKIIITQGMVVR